MHKENQNKIKDETPSGRPTQPITTGWIKNCNCIDGMRELPDNSVDLVIADPPYNLSKGNNWKWDNSIKIPGFGGNWEKTKQQWDIIPIMDYFVFCLEWLNEVKRLVKATGSIWIHGTYHNIGMINFAAQLLDIEIINDIIWYKRNSFPNLSGRRLTASHETILWCHTGGKKRQYKFNYEAAKLFSDPTDLLKEGGKQMRSVWDIPNNKDRSEIAYGKHPTQKPLRLLKRMITVSGLTDGILLSPFAGSGSECVAAIQMGMRYIGFETDQSYIDIANKRIQAEMENCDFLMRCQQ